MVNLYTLKHGRSSLRGYIYTGVAKKGLKIKQEEVQTKTTDEMCLRILKAREGVLTGFYARLDGKSFGAGGTR